MDKFFDKYRLRPSDYTPSDMLTPTAILDINQDVAGKHAESFKMGFNDLIAQNQIWVLVRVKCKILKPIKLYERLKAVTWPKTKGLLDFDRESEFYNSNDEKVCIINSKWLVLNATTRKIIPAKKIDFLGECFDDSNFDEELKKLDNFDTSNLDIYEYKVSYSDLDHNGHTNNIKYATMALNAIKPLNDFYMEEFQIDFHHETHLDDVIKIAYIFENNTYYIKGFNDERTIFMMNIKVK